MSFDETKLRYGLLGALLITVGIMLSEHSIESKGPGFVHSSSSFGPYSIIGAVLFIVGWSIFILQTTVRLRWLGIVVATIAILGQLYFGFVLSKNTQRRKSLIYITIAFWMLFILAWIYYVYRLSIVNGKFNKKKAYILYSGLGLLMIGMMGYFFLRKEDWNALTGGIVPKIHTTMGIMNPFVPLVGFGWALIAFGNAMV